MSPSFNHAATLLGLFAQHWQPGRVKPRLALALGESHAALLHGLFVLALVERLAGVADRRQIVFAPAECERAFGCVAKGRWNLVSQGEGRIGERIERFFRQGLAQAERVVLLGTEGPDVPRDILDEAFDALGNHALVLGPAAGGGCYLIGASRRLPPVFDEVAWGTSAAWREVTSHLQAAGVAWHELPQWYDALGDEAFDEADLRALAGRLHSDPDLEPRLAQLRREMSTLLGPDLRRPTKAPQCQGSMTKSR
jgi:uncharacterized protein